MSTDVVDSARFLCVAAAGAPVAAGAARRRLAGPVRGAAGQEVARPILLVPGTYFVLTALIVYCISISSAMHITQPLSPTSST